MIQFGSMSITLMIGALYGVLFATLLAFSKQNRIANRYLALLLIVIAMRLFPFIIGYAGFFDAYPWLSFLPYDASLAIGPLVYFYVKSLSSADQSWRWRDAIHFVPAITQLAYYCIIFPFPLEFKNDWNSRIHEPYVVPAVLALTLISIAAYWWFSLRHYRGYQAWLEANVSDREDHRIDWVRNFLIALGVTLVFWVALTAWRYLISPLNYFQVFPFYLWLQILAYYLGTEGYRNAAHKYHVWVNSASTGNAQLYRAVNAEIADSLIDEYPTSPRLNTDWRSLAEKLQTRVRTNADWRDPELTLASLARRVGTNTSDLSRTINEGLGMNFNEFINRERVASVKQTLAENARGNLLDLALAAGFSSKASFNRSFKLYTGVTPSEYKEKIERERVKS
jgi:AraC-like DNA-binding protein